MLEKVRPDMNKWKDSLVNFFSEGVKTDHSANLGMEVEHFIVDPVERSAVPYSGERGVRQILTRLIERYPEAEIPEEDDFFGFVVPEFAITLEPAAQLEISIAPCNSVLWIVEVYNKFRRQLDAVLSEFGYTAVYAGCHPFTKVEEMEMIPKRRYDLMNAYFKTSGTGGMEMMRGTASLQVSIDYQSERDFREKLQAAYFYGPVFKLLCDNSPYFQGVKQETYLKRTDIWRRTDPSRCGVLPGVFSDSYGFEDYAEYIGGIQPIFMKEGKNITPTGNETVAELFEGRAMNEEEVTHALSMVFPDVRLKKYLELRFADTVPVPFMAAYCVLLKGLLYSEEGIGYAKERIRAGNLSEKDIIHAEDELMEHGWNGEVYGISVSEMTKHMLEMAERNLQENERACLDPFYAVVRYGGIQRIPAEEI